MLSFFSVIFNILIVGSVVVKRNDLQYDNKNFEQLTHDNPLLAAYIFSTTFGIDPNHQQTSFNHPDHLPLNPYLVLLLSHYGRYLGTFNNRYKGLYGYNAANNYHNNKPFGSYKIHEDSDQ